MLQLRFATERDAPVVMDFIRALAEYERRPDAVLLDMPTLASQLASQPPPFECLIADLDGHAQGFALFFHTYSTWRGKRGIWLEDLFVQPHARRNGIGRALLERVAALARERDCARLEWSVLDWNQLAIDFYTGIGAQVLAEWRLCRMTDAALAEFGRSQG